jgi:molecular chaperone DnaK
VGNSSNDDSKIVSVCAKTIGVRVSIDADHSIVRNLIYIDDLIPCTASLSISIRSEQQFRVLHVFQNLCREAAGRDVALEDCTEIGRVEIALEHPLIVDLPIEVTFTIDEEGLLSVTACDHVTGREIPAAFKADALLAVGNISQDKTVC